MEAIINQIFEIQSKLKHANVSQVDRNLERIIHELEEMGYIIESPLGQKYDVRNTSLEATILDEKGKITRVIKPAIYRQMEDTRTLIQKAVVIVE